MQSQKERNLLAGFQFFDTTTGIFAFLMLVLGMFTVTVEVFLRKDMGQRYFNLINYWAGFIVFGVFSILFNAFSTLVPTSQNSFGQSSSPSSLIFFIWLAYVIVGVFHFIRQWWRQEVRKPIHSLYAGDSHLLFLGSIVMNLVNGLLVVPVKMVASFFADEEEGEVSAILPFFKDVEGFTTHFVEPFFLLALSVILTEFSPIVSIWLFLSSIALLFATNIRSQIMRDTILDLQDQMLEASEIKRAMNGTSEFMKVPHATKIVMENIADNVEEDSPLMTNIKTFNPTVAQAMEAIKKRNQPTEVGDKIAS